MMAAAYTGPPASQVLAMVSAKKSRWNAARRRDRDGDGGGSAQGRTGPGPHVVPGSDQVTGSGVWLAPHVSSFNGY